MHMSIEHFVTNYFKHRFLNYVMRKLTPFSKSVNKYSFEIVHTYFKNKRVLNERLKLFMFMHERLG